MVFPRVCLGLPAESAVSPFLEAQRRCDLTYRCIGCTRSGPLDGFDFDHHRILLGHGDAVYEEARFAIASWKMFPPSWTRVTHKEKSIGVGQTVAVAIRVLGLWWLNSARIVYVIDDANRFGFAYGTLPGHVECGEERFMVERDSDHAVWYDLTALSQPRHWTTRIGYPLVRRFQRQFAIDSQAALVNSCAT